MTKQKMEPNLHKLPKIFDDQPKITAKDYKRIAPNIRNWNLLNELFLLGGLTSDDLKRMIVVETAGLHRPEILNKLMGKLTTALREQTKERIEACLKKK